MSDLPQPRHTYVVSPSKLRGTKFHTCCDALRRASRLMLVSGMSRLTILAVWYSLSSSALACLPISPVLGTSSPAARSKFVIQGVHNLAGWQIPAHWAHRLLQQGGQVVGEGC